MAVKNGFSVSFWCAVEVGWNRHDSTSKPGLYLRYPCAACFLHMYCKQVDLLSTLLWYGLVPHYFLIGHGSRPGISQAHTTTRSSLHLVGVDDLAVVIEEQLRRPLTPPHPYIHLDTP